MKQLEKLSESEISTIKGGVYVILPDGRVVYMPNSGNTME
jgi:hypothetical protein